MKAKKSDDNDITKLYKELAGLREDMDGIQNLLILYLLKLGATQNEIAKAVGVTQGTVSRKFEGIDIKEFMFSKGD